MNYINFTDEYLCCRTAKLLWLGGASLTIVFQIIQHIHFKSYIKLFYLHGYPYYLRSCMCRLWNSAVGVFFIYLYVKTLSDQNYAVWYLQNSARHHWVVCNLCGILRNVPQLNSTEYSLIVYVLLIACYSISKWSI